MRNLSMEAILKTKLVGYELTVKQYIMRTLINLVSGDTDNRSWMTPIYDTFGRNDETRNQMKAAIRYLCL